MPGKDLPSSRSHLLRVREPDPDPEAAATAAAGSIRFREVDHLCSVLGVFEHGSTGDDNCSKDQPTPTVLCTSKWRNRIFGSTDSCQGSIARDKLFDTSKFYASSRRRRSGEPTPVTNERFVIHARGSSRCAGRGPEFVTRRITVAVSFSSCRRNLFPLTRSHRRDSTSTMATRTASRTRRRGQSSSRLTPAYSRRSYHPCRGDRGTPQLRAEIPGNLSGGRPRTRKSRRCATLPPAACCR